MKTLSASHLCRQKRTCSLVVAYFLSPAVWADFCWYDFRCVVMWLLFFEPDFVSFFLLMGLLDSQTWSLPFTTWSTPRKSKAVSLQIQSAVSALLPFHQHLGQKKSKEWAGLGHNDSRLAKVSLASMTFHLWVRTALGFSAEVPEAKKAPLWPLFPAAVEHSWGQSTFNF